MPNASNIADILSMMGGAGPDGPSALPKLSPREQAEKLRERFARIGTPDTFAPGDIVREKAGCGAIREDLRCVLVVVRALTDDAYDRDLLRDHVRENEVARTAMKPDLVCADILQSSGKSLALQLQSSALLEKLTDADLNDWPLPKESIRG